MTMSELLAFFLSPGPWLLVPLILFGLLLVGYFDFYLQAMRPPVGTLEWIALYDRPPLSFSQHRYRLSRWDAVPLCLILILIAGCAVATAILLQSDSQTAADAYWLLLLSGNLELAVALLPGYLLLKRLFGSTRQAALGCAAALLACPVSQPTLSGAAFGLTACLWLLYCWLNSDADTPRPGALIALLLSVAAALFSFVCDASAVLAAPGLLALFGAGLALRFRRRTAPGRGRQLWGTLAVTAAAFLIFTAALSLLTGLLGGLLMPEALFAPLQYYGAAAAAQIQALGQIHWSGVLTQAFSNPLLWWGSLFALCAALALGAADHDGRPLALLLGHLALLPVWLCTGTAAYALLAAATLGYVWNGLLRRGHRLAVGLYAGCTMLLGLLTLFSLWLFI